MKTDYWNVADDQVMEKTGKNLFDWMEILDNFNANEKKSNEVVSFLQNEHSVPRYWARTLTTRYMKEYE